MPEAPRWIPAVRLLCLLLSASMFPMACTFWNATSNWPGGVWRGEHDYFEIKHEFEARGQAYVLDRATDVRDFRSVVLRYQLNDDSIGPARELLKLDGWIVPGSLFVARERLLLLHAPSSAADAPRRLLAVPYGAGGKRGATPTALPLPPGLPLEFMPDPGDRHLLVLLRATDSTVRALLLDRAGRPVAEAILPGDEAPASTWAADGSRVYFSLPDAVRELRVTGAYAVAAEFPRCFRRPDGGSDVSATGRMLTRENPDAPPGVRRLERWVPFERTPLIRDRALLGNGCS